MLRNDSEIMLSLCFVYFSQHVSTRGENVIGSIKHYDSLYEMIINGV